MALDLKLFNADFAKLEKRVLAAARVMRMSCVKPHNHTRPSPMLRIKPSVTHENAAVIERMRAMMDTSDYAGSGYFSSVHVVDHETVIKSCTKAHTDAWWLYAAYCMTTEPYDWMPRIRELVIDANNARTLTAWAVMDRYYEHDLHDELWGGELDGICFQQGALHRGCDQPTMRALNAVGCELQQLTDTPLRVDLHGGNFMLRNDYSDYDPDDLVITDPFILDNYSKAGPLERANMLNYLRKCAETCESIRILENELCSPITTPHLSPKLVRIV